VALTHANTQNGTISNRPMENTSIPDSNFVDEFLVNVKGSTLPNSNVPMTKIANNSVCFFNGAVAKTNGYKVNSQHHTGAKEKDLCYFEL
jgi:hypothetical protein